MNLVVVIIIFSLLFHSIIGLSKFLLGMEKVGEERDKILLQNICLSPRI